MGGASLTLIHFELCTVTTVLCVLVMCRFPMKLHALSLSMTVYSKFCGVGTVVSMLTAKDKINISKPGHS